MKLKKILCGALSFALLAGYAFFPEKPPFAENMIITAEAENSDEDYDYQIAYDQAIITGYNGREKNLVVPDTIEGHKVTKIKGAFKNNEIIESVKLPDTVKIISENSFSGCSNLKRINFPKSLTKIGDKAFYNCKSLSAADIPDSVTEIGEIAFSDCIRLSRVNIPDGIKKIKERTFYHCSSLLRADIPESVKTIGDGAFMNCTRLECLTLHEGLEEICDFAFTSCSSLLEVIIPESMTSIQNVFQGCEKLKSVYIPKTVTEINGYAFNDCGKLTIYGIPESYAETYSIRRRIKFGGEDLPVLKPTSPLSLKVEKGDSGEAVIKWVAVGSADGYEIYMAKSSEGEYKKIKTVDDYLKSSSKYSGLKDGKVYYFKMRSFKQVNGKKLYSGYTKSINIKL